MKVYAKSSPLETIKEHTDHLHWNFDQLLNDGFIKYTEPNVIAVIKRMIELHDYGKLQSTFQNKLKVENHYTKLPKNFSKDSELPHEWLSIAFINKEDKKLFNLLQTIFDISKAKVRFVDLIQYSIAYHHTRKKEYKHEQVKEVIIHDLEPRKDLLNIAYELNTEYNIKNDFYNRINSDLYFHYYFPYLVFFKGLLHKCDWAASAHIAPEVPYNGTFQTDFKNWLGHNFNLRPYQLQAANDAQKSHILIASTGMGKTEYAMNWMNGDKSFYLLGIRTAVNAIYNRFKEVFNSNKKHNVELLHGEIASVFIEEDTDDFQHYLDRQAKARQLANPITVATADQLTTAVYKYNGFEHTYFTMSYSKIVIDEIQSFAPKSIAAIVVFLTEVAKLGAKFLLMTATLPRFIIKDLKEVLDIETPIEQLSTIKRHKYEMIDQPLDSDGSTAWIQSFVKKKSGKRILIICNTVSLAREIYTELNEVAKNVNLFTSAFIKRDRKCKECLITKAGKFIAEKELPASIWITTQLVEASLDIDFDYLISDGSSIESLFQRFGRCWRNRKNSQNEPIEYMAAEANIYIFNPSEHSSLIYEKLLLTRTQDELKKWKEANPHTVLSEKEKQELLNLVFEEDEQFKSEYREKYNNEKQLLNLGLRADNKKHAQKLFRETGFTHLVIPEPIFENNKEHIESILEKLDRPKKNLSDSEKFELRRLKKDLLSFTMSFHQRKEEHGYLLHPIKENSNTCEYLNLRKLKGVEYSFKTGLNFDKEYIDRGNFI